jgi:hypothetical protein
MDSSQPETEDREFIRADCEYWVLGLAGVSGKTLKHTAGVKRGDRRPQTAGSLTWPSR